MDTHWNWDIYKKKVIVNIFKDNTTTDLVVVLSFVKPNIINFIECIR